MRKNTVKTQHQVEILTNYLKKTKGQFTSSDFSKIAQQTNLTQAKVKKWYWDKKRIPQNKKSVASNPTNKQDLTRLIDNEAVAQSEQVQITIQNCQIKIPQNLRIATEFEVDSKVSQWAKKILKFQGWQLIKLAKNEQDYSDDLNQKPDQPAIFKNSRKQLQNSEQNLNKLLNQSEPLYFMNELYNNLNPPQKQRNLSKHSIIEEKVNHENIKELEQLLLQKEHVGGNQLNVDFLTVKKKPLFSMDSESSYDKEPEQINQKSIGLKND